MSHSLIPKIYSNEVAIDYDRLIKKENHNLNEFAGYIAGQVFDRKRFSGKKKERILIFSSWLNFQQSAFIVPAPLSTIIGLVNVPNINLNVELGSEVLKLFSKCPIHNYPNHYCGVGIDFKVDRLTLQTISDLEDDYIDGHYQVYLFK